MSVLCSRWWQKIKEINTFVCVCSVVSNSDPRNCSCQAPLSVGFSRQEYWSGLPFPTPGNLPDPGSQPASLVSPALVGKFFTTALPGKQKIKEVNTFKNRKVLNGTQKTVKRQVVFIKRGLAFQYIPILAFIYMLIFSDKWRGEKELLVWVPFLNSIRLPTSKALSCFLPAQLSPTPAFQPVCTATTAPGGGYSSCVRTKASLSCSAAKKHRTASNAWRREIAPGGSPVSKPRALVSY